MSRIMMVWIGAVFALSSAYAMPTIGDHAEYVVDITEGANSTSETYIKDLVAFDGHKYTVNWKRISGIQQTTGTYYPDEDKLLKDEWIENIFKDCGHIIGTPATVETPLGSMETCVFDLSDETRSNHLYIGRVTFGIVKNDITYLSSGRREVMTIKVFRNGTN